MTVLSEPVRFQPVPAASARLSGFRDLLRVAGTSFLPVGLIARLPAAMTPLALIAFVAQVTGSFTVAGLTVTGSALGTACGAPLMGALVDRLGQRTVLLTAAVLNAVVLVGLGLLPAGTAWPPVVLAGVLVGMSAPQIGGMARVRWLALGRTLEPRPAGDLTRLSMSWEGLADEVSYIVGPALAGLLAALSGPGSALLVAGAISGLSGAAFALHPTQALTSRSTPAPSGRAPGPMPGQGPLPRVRPLLRLIAVPLAAMSMLGVLFAATQTALTVYATDLGRPAAGGLLYAAMAVTSAGSAALMSRVPDRFGIRLRVRVSATGLLTGVLGMALAAHGGSVLWMAVAVLFTGTWVSPVLITMNALVGELAPARRMATAMALVASAIVTGVAVGASAAGALADDLGAEGAFAVSGLAIIVLLGLALVGRAPRTAAA